MAAWLELHCDNPATTQGCFNGTGHFLFDRLAMDTNKEVLSQLSSLKKLAKKNGWQRVNGKLLCPYCVKKAKE